MNSKFIPSIKVLLIVLAAVPLFFASETVFAQPDINVYFFNGEGCPHCAAEQAFLESIGADYPNLKIHDYEVYYNNENQALFIEVAKQLNVDTGAIPFTVIGEEYFIGFFGQVENSMREKIEECSVSFCPSPVDGIISGGNANSQQGKPLDIPEKISFPFLGEVNTKNFSLPFLTFLFGALDGFNPCAMWILIFLISLILGMKDRKRMWVLGVAFLVASAAAYYVFMAAWLNLILFIGFIAWIRILIGFVALGGGAYSLRDYFKNKEAVCEVGDVEKKEKIIERLKEVIKKEKFLLALIGVIAIAFAVNLLELVCSAGLPVIYTQILTMNDLVGFQYYLYLLLYVFFFMLDDLIVFSAAMLASKAFKANSKYSRFSRLAGGIIMLIIGLLMILKPELLMFG